MDIRDMKLTMYRPGEEGSERLKRSRKGKKERDTREEGYWWNAKAEELPGRIDTAGRSIESQQEYRTQSNLRHARIYGNFDAVGFGLRDYARSASGWLSNEISYNAVEACVDTLHSKLGKSRPRASFQTFGGDWGMQRKAKKLDKFCQGLFYQAKTYQQSQMALFDGLVLGTGFVQVYEDARHRICHERVFPDELLIDDADGIHATPRQLFRRKSLPREMLLAEYGAAQSGETKEVADLRRQAILDARPLEQPSTAGSSFGDMLRVWEAWHLPSGPDAGDGLHVIAIDACVLWQEKWTKEHFGLAVYRYSRPLLGFWGRGLGERLWGIQLAINRTARDIDECLRLLSKPKWLVEASSDVNAGHIRGGSGSIGDVLKYNRVKPEIYAPQAVAPEHFAEIDRLWAKAFEQEGISPQEATAQKPAGLDSAVAQREYNDIASERHAIKGQDWEQFHLDIAGISIDLAREISAREGGKGDYQTAAPIRKVLYPVKWSEVELEKDCYVMQAFPASSLPTTPAARTQMVDEWVQRGWVSPEEAPRAMNIPDLEETSSLQSAALDDVDAAIDEILDGGEAEAVDEFENTQLRIQRGMAAYFRAKRQGAPLKVLEELHAFVKLGMDAATMRAAAKAAPPPDAAGAALLGAPSPVPEAPLPGVPPGPGIPPPVPGLPPGGAPPPILQ
jgi:hypothetical protein